jgi:hypothetical protein
MMEGKSTYRGDQASAGERRMLEEEADASDMYAVERDIVDDVVVISWRFTEVVECRGGGGR